MLAARALLNKAVIRVGARSGGRFAVEVTAPEPGPAAAEFLNEALNQQCRIDFEGKNSAAAEMITVKALLSAAGGVKAAGSGKKGNKNP